MNNPDYSKEYGKIHRRLRRLKECREADPLPYLNSSVYCLEHNSENKNYLIGHASEYICQEHGVPPFPPEPVEEQPSDEQIERNIDFPYLLLRDPPPSGSIHQHKRVTILLHGLNERTLLKYMPWAYHVCQRTEEPVVLFPLSFSVNRVLPEWRAQIPKIHKRRKRRKGNKRAHRFNTTISERLELHPERFFWGAMQSYWDIVDLVRQIRQPEQHLATDGSVPLIAQHFDPNARIDFLGYSSGGYLALAHLAVDHEGLFSQSRACLFASCVEMDELRPASPYVVDQHAENALRDFFVDYLDALPDKRKKNIPNERMRHWLDHHLEGVWMRSFGGHLLDRVEKDRAEREKRLQKISQRVLGIANTNDLVMRWRPMRFVLQGDERDTGIQFEKLDLGIHEHPFAFQDYNQSESEFVLGTVNEELYGDAFEQFIDLIVEHLKKEL